MRATMIVVLVLLPFVCGCQSDQQAVSLLDPLGLLAKPPVRIGIDLESKRSNELLAFLLLATEESPWSQLQRELSKELDQPVSFERLKPFQIEAHLTSGRIQYAFVTAGDYLEMEHPEQTGKVLALMEADPELVQRQGLLVANAKSGIQSISQLKGRRFAFGPVNDPVLHTAALKALSDTGIEKSDLAWELLAPVTGHHISSKEVAKSIVYELTIDAGAIEKSEYDAMPETGGTFIPLAFAKDQFRVLGQTNVVEGVGVASGAFMASNKVDAEQAETVKNLLLKAERTNPEAIFAMGIRRFEPVKGNPGRRLAQMAKQQPNVTTASEKIPDKSD